MARNRGVESGMTFDHVEGRDFKKFFSYLSFFNKGGLSLKIWDKESRLKAWREFANEILFTYDLTVPALAAYMGRTPHEMSHLYYRKGLEPPFGLVLDLGFVFNRDPARVYPELLWLRDHWMQEYMTSIKAAQSLLAAGELGTLTEVLTAMEISATRYSCADIEEFQTDLILPTKADFTERYAELVIAKRWRHSTKEKHRPTLADEMLAMRQELIDDVKARRILYEQAPARHKKACAVARATYKQRPY